MTTLTVGDEGTAVRARRSVLVVAGSDAAELEAAKGLVSDAVLLDLETSVPASGKAAARSQVVDALVSGGWGDRLRLVRVNGLSTSHTYRDVIEVVEGAGRHLDAIVLPMVQEPAHVVWLDLLLAQIESTMGLEVGGIGIEAQVGSARGMQQVGDIAWSSPRLQALVFTPGDYAADLGLRTPSAGAEPVAGAFDTALLATRTAATAAGLQAIDGPWPGDGFRARVARSAQLGFDGAWVQHPRDIDVAHEVFTSG